MRQFLSISMAALWLTVVVAGCRLPGLRGPVSADLAKSRQLSQQGIASLERGQPQEAEAALTKAVKTCPTDPDARRYYAEALWAKNARPEAVAQLEEACRLSPEDTGLRVRLAEMYLTMGRVDLARSTVEQVIDLNPKLPAAWAIRGRTMRAAGDLRQALADFHRALGYVPDDRLVLMEIAEVYRQLHQPQRALETLQSLADTYSPGDEPQQVCYLLGLAYAALGRNDDAVDSLSMAVARDRPTPEILCRLAEAQWAAGRTSDAAAVVQQALALDPQYPPGRELFARFSTAQHAPADMRR